MKIETDIPYREAKGYDPGLNTLDIYFAPPSRGQKKKPIAIFLHGGDWSGGDKACFVEIENRSMPGWFVEQGHVFVAMNFRLASHPRSPDAGVADMADDIARAVKWLSVHGRRYGGHISDFVLVGYSSGAHLAALVATDMKYLKRYRLGASQVRAVIGLDVPFYDVPFAMETLRKERLRVDSVNRRVSTLLTLFGETRAAQERVSPTAHLGPSLRGMHFLLLTAGYLEGRRQDFSQRMSERFCQRLAAEGIDAHHRHFAKLQHADFITGFPGEIGDCVAGFLGRLTDHPPKAICRLRAQRQR